MKIHQQEHTASTDIQHMYITGVIPNSLYSRILQT